VKGFLVLVAACAEPHDASRVHGDIANACAQPYVEPADASVVLTLHVTSTIAPPLTLRAMCLRLDGHAVLLTDTLEITTGKTAERDLRVTAGEHTLDALGEWVRPVSSGFHSGAYTYVAKSSHTFDASRVHEVALAFELPQGSDDAVAVRLKARWTEP
jgi:hypothetical protein